MKQAFNKKRIYFKNFKNLKKKRKTLEGTPIPLIIYKQVLSPELFRNMFILFIALFILMVNADIRK